MVGTCSAFRAIEDKIMVQRLLLAGMLCGLIVALFAFAFARVYSEPTIERAITLEESGSHAHAGGEDATSRSVQRNVGLFTGLASYCIALGGLLAIGIASLHGRLGTNTRTTVWMLVTVGYVALVLVPQLKYPANPPGVGSAETIGIRTELYFLVIFASLLSMATSIWIAFRFGRRLTRAAAITAGAAIFVLLAAIIMTAMPAVSETPHDFPRDLLFEFRVHSALVQLIIWGGLAALFGQVAEHVSDRNRSGTAARHAIPNA